MKGSGQKSGDPDWGRGRGGRSAAGSRNNSPPREPIIPPASRSRRASRVARQHSYDDEVKPAVAGVAAQEGGLGLPAPMPRRASAYDVFSVPALSTVTPSPVGRRQSFRVPPAEPASPPSPDNVPPANLGINDKERRPSRRGSQL